MKIKKNQELIIFIGVILVVLAISAFFLFSNTNIGSLSKSAPTDETYVKFDMEAYDKILKNYWMPKKMMSDTQLSEIFRLSVQKVTSATTTLINRDATSTEIMIRKAIAVATSTADKRSMALNIIAVVLYNLEPIGRNGLHSGDQELAFRQTVSNISSSTDLYGNLNIPTGSDIDAVNQAYKEKAAELARATTTEAKAELKQITYAHKVLTDTDTKALYDEAKIEPTVFKNIFGKTLYFNLTRVSPTSLQEFGRMVDNASTTSGMDSMIIDLRGNMGGALDFVTAFLGIFIGENQYAFDLYHQGDMQVQRTTLAKYDELGRYKEIAILTDRNSLSSAELMTSTFKHFKLAHSVGQTTGGWGTVENTYPMETVIDSSQRYLLLLVHSLTLRGDNNPIEGNGVEPDVSIDDPKWKSLLGNYFDSPSLIKALKEHASVPPVTI
ncbi:MAG: S41 family peptidase [Candidatus Taylorbacteria bacterium]